MKMGIVSSRDVAAAGRLDAGFHLAPPPSGAVADPGRAPPAPTIGSWDDLEAEEQADLIAWFNRREEDVDDTDRAALAALVREGRFRAWSCAGCGARAYAGSPEDWSGFQGVRQADFTSYPGDTEKYSAEYLATLCDTCRCHGPG